MNFYTRSSKFKQAMTISEWDRQDFQPFSCSKSRSNDANLTDSTQTINSSTQIEECLAISEKIH